MLLQGQQQGRGASSAAAAAPIPLPQLPQLPQVPALPAEPPRLGEAAFRALARSARAATRYGWISFALQSVLAVASTIVLLFSIAFTPQASRSRASQGRACKDTGQGHMDTLTACRAGWSLIAATSVLLL